MPIKTQEALWSHLQTAIMLEQSTIPPYICAMYTIKPGTNIPAYDVIRSVVVEEMLHMTLACNIMNAVGGSPAINTKEFVPEYPTYMPHSSNAFKVHLRKFSPETITTFMRIEFPAEPDAPPEADNYHTIGQFYNAIKQALIELSAEHGEKNVFCGDLDYQISPEYYYGGGEVLIIDGLDAACEAIDVIAEEGEGMQHEIWDSDHERFGEKRDVAHYFRFQEILKGRYYRYPEDDIKSGPTGDPLAVTWEDVYPMKTDPKLRDYPEGSEVRKKAIEFNQAYFQFLSELHDTFNGNPKLLIPATQHMFNLKDLAVDLIKNPFPGDESMTAGPTFEFIR